MYNRYIQRPDGSFQRRIVPSQEFSPGADHRIPAPIPADHHGENNHQHKPHILPATDFLRRLLPKNLDTGDLLIIVLLLLMAGDSEENKVNALLTLGLYLIL